MVVGTHSHRERAHLGPGAATVCDVLPAPLAALTGRTPRLELRFARTDELRDLAERACGRILAPGEEGFLTGWATLPAGQFESQFIVYHLGLRMRFAPAAPWSCNLAVFEDGVAVGVVGCNWADTPEVVSTGSWLLPEARGRGIGREMRAAMLDLAFDVLGARIAHSTAHPDNIASQAVSEALGYRFLGRIRDPRFGDRFAFRLAATERRWEPAARWTPLTGIAAAVGWERTEAHDARNDRVRQGTAPRRAA